MFSADAVTDNPNRTLYLIMALVSLMLHLVLALLFMSVRARLPVRPPTAREDMIEKRIEFELVDVPHDAEPLEQNVESRYVSDRSARARDTITDPSVPRGEAGSEGLYEHLAEYGQQEAFTQPVLDRTSPASDGQAHSPEQQQLRYQENREQFRDFSFSSKYFEHNRSDSQRQVAPAPAQAQPARPLRNNTESRAPDSGGFSLNTYDWEFAPYMQELKRKIQQNLYLPEAFAQMGLIYGETVIRFRVYRDGHVENIEVLRTTGHESLMHSSINSIKAAQPFKPLPPDFPNELEYLEITGLYTFSIRR
ncbi:energy transducer TonB [bacterium]|nr:energy transducer TonB [bacterium]